MQKLLRTIVFCILSCILFAGCSNVTMQVQDKLSPEEVEKAVKAYILENYGDVVSVKQTGKEELSVPTGWFDGPIGYKTVTDADFYQFEVTPEQYPDLHIYLDYSDGYTKTKDGQTKSEAAVIRTEYQDVKERYELFAVFRELVEQYDGTAVTLQVRQSGNFIAMVRISEVDQICRLHDQLNEFIKKVREQQYLELRIYYVEDDVTIDVSRLEKAELQGNTLEYEYHTVEALGLGEVERFARTESTSIEFVRDFFEERANIESTWELSTGDEDEFLQKIRMHREYAEYKHVILLDTLEPNMSKVRIWAYGIY